MSGHKFETLLLIIGLSCAAGCGDESDASSTPDASNARDAGETGDAGGTDESPLYVISTGVTVADDFVGYLAAVPSLAGGTTFDLDHAAEIGFGSWIFSREGDRGVYVASLAEPTIVRWEVRGEGDFVEGKTLSLANLGISSAYLAQAAPIFSKQKSYFVDDEQDQIVIWNPERMELIDTIALDDEADFNLKPIPEGAIVVHDDLLLVTVGWRDADDTSLFGDHVRLVVIDTKTDQIVHSTIEARNVQESFYAQTSDGTAYFSPPSLYAAYTEIGKGHGARSTVLRISPKQREFDPDYALDMSALVGGRSAGNFTLLSDDVALIRAWHPDLVDKIDPIEWQDVLWSQAGFMWWRWNVGDSAAVLIEDQEPGALDASVFKVDGKTYSTNYFADNDTTSLVEITPQGEFVPAISGPGQVIGGAIRVR